jgi:hypothetical protein
MARTPRTLSRRGHAQAKAGENTRQYKPGEAVTEKAEIFEVSLTRSRSRFGGVLWLLARLRGTSFHFRALHDGRTWREGVLSLKHPRENDWLPGNENPHGRTSGDEERVTIAVIILRKTPRLFTNILPAFLLSGVSSARRTATPGKTCCPVHGSVLFKSYSTQEGRPSVEVPAIRRTQRPRLTERTQRVPRQS